MSTGKVKLTKDLEFLALLASQMDAYLSSDAVFWKTPHVDLPDLTLGGYLMRQQRLLALRDSLSQAEQTRLDTAVAQFNQTIAEKGPLFEKKARQELAARLRQWAAYLSDLAEENEDRGAFYTTAVETRIMIAALIDKLQIGDYPLSPETGEKLNRLDNQLSRYWTSGQFIWPTEWQTAYPQAMYWWLYGAPT